MKIFLKLLLLLLVFFSTPLKTSHHELVFHGAYAFETFSSKGAAATYVSIFNNSKKDIIIKSLSSEIAKIVEIHDIIIENEIVKMQKVDKLLVKAKENQAPIPPKNPKLEHQQREIPTPLERKGWLVSIQKSYWHTQQ